MPAQRRTVCGFSARGWLGQYLMVLAKARAVAVRMRAPEASEDTEKAERYGYSSLAEDVVKLF